ncbi:MAG: hypothetical protein AB7G17_11535 [Phycisphaerales bacterium]
MIDRRIDAPWTASAVPAVRKGVPVTTTRVASFALSALLLALPAAAAPVAIIFTGHVSGVGFPPAPFGSVATNDAATFTLYIDDATPDAHLSSSFGFYGLGITGYSLTIGAGNIFNNSLSEGSHAFHIQNAANDALDIHLTDGPFGFQLTLVGNGSLFSSDAFPSPSVLSAANANAAFSIGTLSDTTLVDEYVQFRWTDASMVSVIPLPAPALLAAAALAPITLVRRRR